MPPETRMAGMTVTDPVCGMDVVPERAAGRSEHEGQAYYFCSPGCKREVDEHPDRYAGQRRVL